MGEPLVLVTRRIPEPGLEILRQSGARITVLEDDEEACPGREELLAAVGNCDVLIAILTEKIDRRVMEASPALLGVANMAVGYDNIELGAATELGIPVTNTPGVLTDTTADLTWAMLMAAARRIPEAHAYTAAGRFRFWGPNLFTGADVSPGGSGRPKVLGIVGFGRIGRAVARRATGFEMEILAYDPLNRTGIEAAEGVAWAELPELVERSDFVTLHAPLVPETHHLIGEAELGAMKPTAYLINAARGPVVDEKALVRALAEDWIAGAALDVYENEPALEPGLAELPNAVLLPHIGSASRDTRGRMAAIAARNGLAHLRRERAPDVVNPEVYDTDAYRRRVER